MDKRGWSSGRELKLERENREIRAQIRRTEMAVSAGVGEVHLIM